MPQSRKIPGQSNFPAWQEAASWADVGRQFTLRGGSTVSLTHGVGGGPDPNPCSSGPVLPPLPSKPFLWLPANGGPCAPVGLTLPSLHFLPDPSPSLHAALSEAPGPPFPPQLELSALTPDNNAPDWLGNSCPAPRRCRLLSTPLQGECYYVFYFTAAGTET